MKAIAAFGAGIVLVQLVIYAAIIFVVVHFALKIW